MIAGPSWAAVEVGVVLFILGFAVGWLWAGWK